MSYDPIAGSANEPWPSNYAPIKAALDVYAVQSDEGSKCNYYVGNRGNGHQHDVAPNDVVFTTRTPDGHSTADQANGIPRVRSSLHGMCKLPLGGMSLSELEKIADDPKNVPPDFDAFVQDIVSSNIQILGVAYGDQQILATIKSASRAFSVKIAGMSRLNVHDYCPQGSFAQAVPPTRAEIKSKAASLIPKGRDAGFVPLKVVPVTPDDLGDFVTRLMNRYIFKTLAPRIDPVLSATTDQRTMSTYQTARAFSNNALLAGVLFLNTAMKYDLVAPSPYFAASGGARFNKSMYRNMESDIIKDSRKQAASIDEKHRRKGLGHTLWYSNRDGGFTYPIQDGDPLNGVTSTHLLPEEASVIIARGVGLLGPINGPNGTGGTRVAPHRGEYMAAKLATSTALADERKDFEHLRHDFLCSMFLSQNTRASSAHPRNYEFGNLDYEKTGVMHAGRTQAVNAGFVSTVNRRTFTGQILQIQLCALFDVMRGIQNVINVQRSRIIGKVTKAGRKGGVADVYITTNV